MKHSLDASVVAKVENSYADLTADASKTNE